MKSGEKRKNKNKKEKVTNGDSGERPDGSGRLHLGSVLFDADELLVPSGPVVCDRFVIRKRNMSGYDLVI